MDMKHKVVLMSAATMMTSAFASATEIIDNDTWQTIANIIPWVSVLVVGIVGIFFVLIPFLIVLKVVGFIGNFLDKLLGLIDKAL